MNLKKICSITLSLIMAVTFSFMGVEAASATTKNIDDNTSSSVSRITAPPQAAIPSARLAANIKAQAKAPKIVNAGSTSTVYNKSIVIVNHEKTPGNIKTYFKIKPKTSGALTISTYAGSDVSIKGAKAGYVNFNSSNPQFRYITFGVKKGKTYTVTVKSAGIYTEYGYLNEVRFITKSFDGKFGKSAKKAAKLSRKKLRKGYIAPNGKAKYYRLSKKGRKIKITFTADANDRLQITIKGKARGIKKYTRFDQTVRGGYNVKVITLRLRGYARDFSGTIQVKRVGKSSGVYSIKYQ